MLLGEFVRADEIRPAYLELRETAEDTYDVLLKVPAKGADKRLALYARFPADCTLVSPVKATFTGTAFVRAFHHHTQGRGSPGPRFQSTDSPRHRLKRSSALRGSEGNSQTTRLTPASPTMVVTAAPTSFQVAKTYTVLGVEHILEGWDHLLFVLCLMMVAGVNRKLLITITGFTVAHSITLALSTLGVVTIPMPPVEAVIALSIVFLATEIVRGNQAGLTYRYPVAVSMSFGLLHGFGFAAVLGEIGLPQNEIPISLLFFNVGVELGQLLFIAAILVIVGLAMGLWKFVLRQTSVPRLWQPTAAYLIGTVATFWTIERIVGFWG